MPVLTFTAHLERFWLLLTLDRQHPGSDRGEKQFEDKEMERERGREREGEKEREREGGERRQRQTDTHTHTQTDRETDRKEKGVIQMDRDMMSEEMFKKNES